MSRRPGERKIATRVPLSLCKATSHPPDPTYGHVACAAREGLFSKRPADLTLANQARSWCGGPHISQKYKIISCCSRCADTRYHYIIPIHTRTEGRAPVWGSEFSTPQGYSLAPHTSGPRDVPRCGALSLLQKDAALQGGSSRNRCRLNVKLRDLRGGFFLPHA